MFGFGHNKKTSTPEPEAQGRVQTIPDIFYGGNDPEIYHRKASVENAEKAKAVSSVAKAPTATAAPVARANRHGLLWGICGVVFVAAIGGIGWYYTLGLRVKPVVKNPPPTTVFVNDPIVLPVKTPPVATTTVETVTTTPAAPTSTLIAGGPLDFAPLNPLDTVDFDRDMLTDAEEEAFGTDPAVWDTEKDGYYDGQEVFNLYNPLGMAPVRLIDSGAILEYSNSIFNYRFYYPKGWTVAAVDAEGRQIVITSANGDYIEVRALAKLPNDDFNTWFARNITGQNITDLLQITNRFEVSGWKRRDDLVAYFMGSNETFVILYHPLSGGPVAYRHIAQMVAQSFRSSRVNLALPDQPVLPGAATTTAVNTSTL